MNVEFDCTILGVHGKSDHALGLIRAAVIKTAADIVVEARGKAPVRTGALKTSIYAVYPGSPPAVPPVIMTEGGKSKMIATFDAPHVQGDYEAVVCVGVEYGFFVEYGTRRMKAQPFLTPAVENHKQALLDAVAFALSKAWTS